MSRGDARAQLLEAASSLMRERDTLDISLSDISERAKLNSALIKYYFGNKEGFLRALLQRDVAPGVRQLGELVKSDLPFWSKLRIHIEGLINVYSAYPYLNRLLMRLMRETSAQQAQQISDEFLAPIASAYDQLLGEGIALGEIKPIDPELFYFNIIGACDPFFSARIVLRHCYGVEGIDDAWRRRYIRQTSELILNGLRKA